MKIKLNVFKLFSLEPVNNKLFKRIYVGLGYEHRQEHIQKFIVFEQRGNNLKNTAVRFDGLCCKNFRPGFFRQIQLCFIAVIHSNHNSRSWNKSIADKRNRKRQGKCRSEE